MCDEYDDERMREFWRQLARLGYLANLDSDDEPLDAPVGLPAIEPAEPKRAKARMLTR